MRDRADKALADASDSLTLNPRARRHRAELAELQALLDRFSPIVTQLIGMTRAFCERYDAALQDEPTVTAIAEQLDRAAHDVRLAVTLAGAPADPADVTEEPPALTTPLSVATPSSDHWILVGSLLIDLLRIHSALAESDDAH